LLKEEVKETDYIYCETCRMFVDFLKYDHDLEDAGHAGHKTRNVTSGELKQLVAECEKNNCFKSETDDY
jgi:hypothetical protein